MLPHWIESNPLIPLYLQCDDCGQVESQQAWKKLSKYRYKCRYCHKTRHQSIWPGPELLNLLNFIIEYDNKSKTYPQVACVFISSALELFLENLISVMAYQDNLYEDVSTLVGALLDGYQGRERMLTLFSKIGYGTFPEAVKQLGNKQFIKNWNTITKARNNVAHGHISTCDEITPALIEQTIIDALDVFSKLHNQHNSESLQYRVATEHSKKL